MSRHIWPISRQRQRHRPKSLNRISWRVCRCEVKRLNKKWYKSRCLIIWSWWSKLVNWRSWKSVWRDLKSIAKKPVDSYEIERQHNTNAYPHSKIVSFARQIENGIWALWITCKKVPAIRVEFFLFIILVLFFINCFILYMWTEVGSMNLVWLVHAKIHIHFNKKSTT